MKRISSSATVLGLSLMAACAQAQQQAPRPLTSTPVTSQQLTDSIFPSTTMTSNQIVLAPGATLTNPHSHPGDLFGYIVEGAVLTGLEHGELIRYEEGEMFYEPKGILHTHFQNASDTVPAKVLIVLIAKGDEG